VANLVLFSYIVGEISDSVMAGDAELVQMRNRILAVESLIASRKLEADLATEARVPPAMPLARV
jgi:hypothetical protein